MYVKIVDINGTNGIFLKNDNIRHSSSDTLDEDHNDAKNNMYLQNVKMFSMY